jgi:hypothetical protein
MSTFRIIPVSLTADRGWAIETTHDNGVIEKSAIFKTRAKAEAAVQRWRDLDEDWKDV